MHSVREVRSKLKSAATSNRGRNVITFLVFLAISTAFWFVMALNEEIQHEFEVPVEITRVPSDVTILSNVPSHLSVNIKDKGTSLIRWNWGNIPHLDLPYTQFQNNGRTISMNSTQLTGVVRALFGGTANIVEVKPDSLSLAYTNNPPVKKAIEIVADISVSPQYTISGPLRLSVDSVSAYSTNGIPRNLVIRSDSINLLSLTDTTYVTVSLLAPEGIKLVPSKVELMVPVEPLISKRRSISVEVSQVPDSIRVITFPSTIDINYTVPISIYNNDDYNIKAVVPYIPNLHKLPVSLANIPDVYNSVILLTDSVEYLVERR